jgi:hypothetical protein
MKALKKESKTIPRSGTQDHCTNYEWLLTRGLQYCQDLGGDLWTDFNQHDPGVTILQQLCYAITDLAYRTDFPIADIMAAPPHANSPEQPLYTGDRILTSNPVTVADYQQLLYDKIDGVKNSWLVPIDDHPQGIRGLYEVQVETREDIDSANTAQIENIRQQVEQWMRSTRNLAEDVERVTILTPQPIGVEAVVEIRPQANPVTVLAQVLFKIQNSLIPFPSVQLVDELFQRLQPDQIWNGPPLSRALDQANLQPLKRTVEAQEIVNIILQVPGVKQVKHLRTSSPPGAPSASSIQIKPGCVPRLDPPILKLPRESYTISIELEGGVKWQVDSKAVWARIQELEAQMRNIIAYAARSSQAISYRRLPAGEYKAVEDYVSIQHQFPVVYGLSKYGIADSLVEGTLSPARTSAWDPQASKPQAQLAQNSKTERQARVQQLKAYLLFFEQLLANYLSQLAHVGELFSLDDRLHQSYFYQPLVHHPPRPSDPQKITDLLVQQPASAARNLSHYLVCIADPSGKIVFVSNRIEKRGQAEELRSRLIESGQHRQNYRFRKSAENEYQLILHAAAGTFLAAGQERFATSEAARTAAERWAGFMAGLVGIKQLLDRLVKIYRREDLGLQVIDENSRILLTSTGIRSREEVDRRIEEIIAFGADPRAYRFAEAARGGFRVHLQNDRGQLIAEGEEYFETEFDAEEGVDRLSGLMERMAHDDSLRENHIRRLPQVEEIGKNPLQVYQDNLDRLERQHDHKYLNRRNDVLNHLLARFGERFDDDILEQLDMRPFGERDDFYHERIRWKIEFLRCYVDATPAPGGEAQGAGPATAQTPNQSRHGEELGLGSGRGQGFDYGATDGSNPVSGLERRLSLLLGLQGHMHGREYHRMDKESLAESGFYYIEKQVARTAMERVEDEKGRQHVVPQYRILDAWRAGEPDLQDLRHNFVFSSEDSGILRHLLTFGANKENYGLHPARDGYHVLFQPPSSKEGMEIHRAGSREQAEQAVESLIRFLQQLNQNAPQSYMGERLWLVEHVLLRPRSKQPHSHLRISHKTGIHLSSGPLHKDLQPEYLELVLRHGQHHENYRIQTDSLGDVIVVLYREQEAIAHTNALASAQEAAAAIALLVQLLGSMSRDHAVRKEHVHMDAPDTFYSHRLSVFLPNWPLRFQGNEFKLYAEQMVQENCPAHLAVNCFWLSAHDEKAFDKMYRDWKALSLAAFGGKEAIERDLTALDEASEKLKTFIEQLQREQERRAASSGGRK